MAPLPPGDTRDEVALRAAERVLAAAFGGRARLELLAPLVADTWRNRVLRCRLRGAGSGAPGTVVVKQPRSGYDPERGGWPTVGLLNEWAGLQFLGSLDVAPPLAPRFYGGDLAAGVIVLEDLTPAEGGPPAGVRDPELDPEIARFKTVLGGAENVFFALMRRDRPRAERLLLRSAAGLGRLHAATAGREAEYHRERAALGPEGPSPAAALTGALPRLREDLGRLGISRGPDFDGEAAAVAAAAAAPGPFRTYTHGDPCPGNDLVVGDAVGEVVRPIDFELGGFGHALRDGVYPLVFFPTCGSTGALPDAIASASLAAYRRELTRGVPGAGDDRRFDRAVVEMCSYWTLQTLCGGYGQHALGRALDGDRGWGRATMRARIVTRVHRFLAVVQERRGAGEMAAMAATMERLAERLAEVWPDAGEIRPYPAFASG